MTAYHLALYAHILGVLALFVAMGLEWTSMVRMRRARTVEQVREWASLHTTLDKIFPLAVAIILIAGLYMVSDVWGWSNAWINLALAGLVVMGIMGALINGRRLRAIQAAAEAAPAGPIPATLTRQIQDPMLWMSVKIMATLSLGVVYLMAAKPEAGESVATLALALLIGWVWGQPTVRERLLAAQQRSA